MPYVQEQLLWPHQIRKTKNGKAQAEAIGLTSLHRVRMCMYRFGINAGRRIFALAAGQAMRHLTLPRQLQPGSQRIRKHLVPAIIGVGVESRHSDAHSKTRPKNGAICPAVSAQAYSTWRSCWLLRRAYRGTGTMHTTSGTNTLSSTASKVGVKY